MKGASNRPHFFKMWLPCGGYLMQILQILWIGRHAVYGALREDIFQILTKSFKKYI